MAEVLKDYDETNILIEGHTDSVGEDAYNQKLSVNRADAVASYLRLKDVKRNRLVTKGYGESQPIASNADDSGQKLNRRVEVVITANEKLKKSVKKEVEKKQKP